MPAFRYIAYDNKGKKKEGVLEESSIESAISLLKKDRIYPQEIHKITRKKESRNFLDKLSVGFKGRISQKQKTDTFFQLATLIDSGIGLHEALDITSQQTSNPQLKEMLKRIRDRVNEGIKFSKALYEYRNVFSDTYIKMIEIAEKTGKLSEILFKIAFREEEKNSFNQKIISVIAYPAFVLVFGLAIVGFLLIYVVPKMEKIFASFHKQLPFITRMLISIGIFLKNYFFIAVLFVLLIAVILRLLYLRDGQFRYFIEKQLLSIPLYKRITVARFTSALSFQLDSDIRLVDAVLNSRMVVKNFVFRDIMESIAKKIEDGVLVDAAFREANIFDSMFIASIATGQKSGRLNDFVRRISEYYEKKISSVLKTIVSVSEPAAILFLGLIVGFIVMSIMVPLFNINQLVK